MVGYPASVIVGTSGRSGTRCASVTARARSLPALTNWIAEGRVVNITCVCPPIRSVTAGPAPLLYGTCRRSMPASFINISVSRRFWLPAPGDPKLSCPFLSFA